MKGKGLFLCGFIFAAIFIFSSPSFCEEGKYGTLNVYSKIGFVSIYIDNEFIGETPFESNKIQVGSHLLTGTLSGESVYESIIEIKEGEVTTIFIQEAEKKQRSLPFLKEEEPKEEKKEFKNKTISGPFLRLGYSNVAFYSTASYGFEYDASSLSYGIGYKLGLTPYIDIMLTVDRSNFSNSDAHWYVMPVTVLIAMSYAQSPYMVGKQYYGIGLSNFFTDLENEDGDNLSLFGYTIVYGLEMPLSDNNSMFFDIVYNMADSSRYKLTFGQATITAGMRWGL